MTQFLMLMRRECMQHRTGWLVVLLAPTLLLLMLGLMDGAWQINIDNDGVHLPPLSQQPALVQTCLLVLAVTGVTFGLALLSVGFQLPGLAWRDQQDHSAEFWSALPVGHAKSLGAMLFTQVLALPGLAIAVGMLGGVLASLVSVSATLGPLAWLAQPWGLLLAGGAAMLLRLGLGLLVAVAWLSPLLLLTMAASAWLCRWGVPLVAAVVLAGIWLLDQRLPVPMVGPALRLVSSQALQALLFVSGTEGFSLGSADAALSQLRSLPGLLLSDLGPMLGRALTPGLALALAGAALGFWLLVLRRQRGS